MKQCSHFLQCCSAIGLLLLTLLAVPVQSFGNGVSCEEDRDCPEGKVCIAGGCGEEIVTYGSATVPILRPYFPIDPPPPTPTYSAPFIYTVLIFPSNLHDQNDNGLIDCWSYLTGDTGAPRGDPMGYRQDPFTGERRFHNGIDIEVPNGTILRAAQVGTVHSIEDDNKIGKGSGNERWTPFVAQLGSKNKV